MVLVFRKPTHQFNYVCSVILVVHGDPSGKKFSSKTKQRFTTTVLLVVFLLPCVNGFFLEFANIHRSCSGDLVHQRVFEMSSLSWPKNTLLLGLLFYCAQQVCSECCSNSGKFSCCGNGACNFFCCNCAGGCRSDCNFDASITIGAAGVVAPLLVGRRKRASNSTTAGEEFMERFQSIGMCQLQLECIYRYTIDQSTI